MKKEIDASRAKDISQGGLTQGQQTQISRNEKRTEQQSHGKKKGAIEEEEELFSNDDEFYDRTKKPSSKMLVLDKTEQLQKELSDLQSEYDRAVFLLKIADSTGEAAKKRDSKVLPENTETSAAAIKKQRPLKPRKPVRLKIQKVAL
ncbi:hypothetical protein ABKV19_010352 [Rosa sericea]